MSLRIGPYEVKARLGRGGMGEVFFAHHHESGRLVAIKRARQVETMQLASLRREIYALSRLRHPGIVLLVDHGVEGGLPWCALEFVNGETLLAVLQPAGEGSTQEAPERDTTATAIVSDETVPQGDGLPYLPEPRGVVALGAPPPDVMARSLTAVRLLCEPLAFLHGEGIVHCDLKPANVVIRPDGSPVIIDFGQIVHFSGPHGRERVDESFIPVGTYEYMAPERIRRELVDARADLYAIGCILYEILTGRPPFIGEYRLVLRQHIATKPVPPSRMAPGVSPEMDDLVMRLLEKDPRSRIGYADSVAAALEAAGIHAPSRPPPPSLADSRGAVSSGRVGQPARAYLYRPSFAGQAVAMRRIVTEPGGLVLVGAESGAGKTRLALEAGRVLAGEMRVVTGECMPIGPEGAALGAPLHPLAPLLRAIGDECRSQGPGMTDTLLGRRGRVLADHEPTLLALPEVAALPPPARLPPEAAQQRLYSDLAETMFAFASLQRLMLILDDLQWADDLTLGFLRSLTPSALADHGVLIVGTYRKDEADEALWRLAARPGVRSVELARLDRATVAQIARDMLALRDPPEALIDRLVASSDGNPFFVAEYLRAAVEDGLLARDAQGRWGEGPGIGDARHGARPTVPGAVREIVERRLDALSSGAKLLAFSASVLGREVEQEILERVARSADAGVSSAPATGRARLVAVEELLARQILEEAPRGLRFVHDMLREAAYERVPPSRKKALHLAAALAIEETYSARGQLPAAYAALAHHYGAAEAFGKTFHYLERAAEGALAAGAHAQVRALVTRLLALDGARGRPVTPLMRARYRRWLGEAAYGLGDLRGLGEHTAQGLSELGRPLPRGPLQWGGALASGLARQISAVVGEALGRGRPSSEERPPAAPAVPAAADDEREARVEIAQMAAQLAIPYYFAGDAWPLVATSLLAVNAAEGATGVAGAAASRCLSRPYAYLGLLAGLSRLHPAARLYFRRAEGAARTSEDPDGVAFALALEATYLLCLCDWQAAERAAEQAQRLQLQSANALEAALVQTILGHIEYFTGRFDASRARFEALAATSKRRMNEQHRAWGLYCMARCDLAEDRPEAALELLREAEATLADVSDDASALIVDGLFALAHAALGDLAAAAHRADRIARRIDRPHLPTVFSTAHAYVALAEVRLLVWERGGAGAGAAARALRACALLSAFASLFPLARPAAQRCWARARHELGARAQAARLLARSAETARALGMPHEVFLARRELDILSRRRGAGAS